MYMDQELISLQHMQRANDLAQPVLAHHASLWMTVRSQASLKFKQRGFFCMK